MNLKFWQHRTDHERRLERITDEAVDRVNGAVAESQRAVTSTAIAVEDARRRIVKPTGVVIRDVVMGFDPYDTRIRNNG